MRWSSASNNSRPFDLCIALMFKATDAWLLIGRPKHADNFSADYGPCLLGPQEFLIISIMRRSDLSFGAPVCGPRLSRLE